MWPVFQALLEVISTVARSRLPLQLEVVALRHQLSVYRRSVKRPRIRPGERILWSWLSPHCPRWRAVLAFVHPATVLAWQRRRFREHWARISRHGPPGRPTVSNVKVLFVLVVLLHHRRKVVYFSHARRILTAYLHHYHRWRTHLSLSMDSPDSRPVQPADLGTVVEIQDVGGLHRHYGRMAA